MKKYYQEGLETGSLFVYKKRKAGRNYEQNQPHDLKLQL